MGPDTFIGLTEEKLKRIIEKSLYKDNFDIEGYSDKTDFIEDSSEEILGRSILSHAFKDDEISDIFCMSWDNIWVERKGVNEPYPYKFRDADHYEDIIKRVVEQCFKEEKLENSKLYISITLTTPEHIHEINKQYRNVDKETDVLSFPMFEKNELEGKIENQDFSLQSLLLLCRDYRNRKYQFS